MIFGTILMMLGVIILSATMIAAIETSKNR